MEDKNITKLVRSEAEIKQLLLSLMVRFSYMSIALAADSGYQLQSLFGMVDVDPSILGTSYFGRIDN